MPARARHLAEYALYLAFEGLMRHMPWGAALAMGEAAGVGAALAVRHNIKPGDVDIKEIQRVLVERGAMPGCGGKFQ
jgi:hypothetical protein